jgi:hypothetical protein
MGFGGLTAVCRPSNLSDDKSETLRVSRTERAERREAIRLRRHFHRLSIVLRGAPGTRGEVRFAAGDEPSSGRFKDRTRGAPGVSPFAPTSSPVSQIDEGSARHEGGKRSARPGGGSGAARRCRRADGWRCRSARCLYAAVD